MKASAMDTIWHGSRATPQHTAASSNETPDVGSQAHDVRMAPPRSSQARAARQPSTLQACLLTALDIAHKPDTVLADRIVTGFETLRYWLPQCKTWVRHPQRAEAFFRNMDWPPMDPVAAGVLVGLTYRARSIALQHSPPDTKKEQPHMALAAAVQRGLLSVPALQPYASVIHEVFESETQGKHPPDATNLAVRTDRALLAKSGAQPPDVAHMRQIARDTWRYETAGLRYTKVRSTPAPLTLTPAWAPLSDTAHLEALQSHIVSFVQYHNREDTGRDIVEAIRELIQQSRTAPQRLSNIPLTQGALSLQSNFVAGALVGTLYLGLFHGLQDLLRKGWRGPSAETIALCKYASDQWHTAMGTLATAITAAHWDQMAFIVRTSLGTGVRVQETRARLMTYVNLVSCELQRAGTLPDTEASLLEQLQGTEWRLYRYPVTRL